MGFPRFFLIAQYAWVEDATCRLLLEKRNLLFETWPQICADMGIGMRWAQTRHREAMVMVQGILDRMWPEE